MPLVGSVMPRAIIAAVASVAVMVHRIVATGRVDPSVVILVMVRRIVATRRVDPSVVILVIVGRVILPVAA